jgi:hypothetical protein
MMKSAPGMAIVCGFVNVNTPNFSLHASGGADLLPFPLGNISHPSLAPSTSPEHPPIQSIMNVMYA